MIKYKYVAVTRDGRYRRGSLQSENELHAIAQLADRGMKIVELLDPQQNVWTREFALLQGKVKKDHFTLFCRQLATMYTAGVNLVQALEIVSRQSASKPLRQALDGMVGDMRNGSSFSSAAMLHPKAFHPVFVHLIEAGEASGRLDEMLQRIAMLNEKEHHTREKLKSAMIYPAIMSVAITGVVAFLMMFIVPNYIRNFEQMNVPLPLPTVIVMTASGFLQHYGLWLFGGLLLVAAAGALWRKTEGGRLAFDSYKLRIPVFGTLWHKQAIARFSRTFASLHAAAVPYLQTITISAKVADNAAIGQALLQSRENVSGGNSIIEPLQVSGKFPPMVIEMMEIGEKTGTLDTMMGKVADYYEADVEMMADRLKAMLEPLLIIGMTAAVGIVVLAIMLPSFSIMRGL